MRVHLSSVTRRGFLGWGMAGLASPALAEAQAARQGGEDRGLGHDDTDEAGSRPYRELEDVTIRQLQAAMAAGHVTARQLTEAYIARIRALDWRGPTLKSVLEVNPDAVHIAAALDAERKAKGPRGPLHGIPILIKDNIDTADRMTTTAGSLALEGSHPLQDSTMAARLRRAGAVILGKTNMSEWANFRSFHSSSGWSGRGGQCKNPYVLDRNPCGSSSGSGAATSASLCAAALATETDGSIVCPATACGIVGIKPTVGLTSRAGVIPISHTQDTIGPHARTVADAAILLSALTGVDPRDPATARSVGKVPAGGYAQFLNPSALHGAKIGVARQGVSEYSEETDAIFERAIQALRDAGATVFDPVDISSIDEINGTGDELLVLEYEFKADLNAYLASLGPTAPIRTLKDLIAFNTANADREMPFFLQELLEASEARGPLTDKAYLDALANGLRRGGRDGIDAALATNGGLDALVAPTGSPAWTTDLINGDHFLGASSSPAAIVGYPLITVPMGDSHGLPVGLTFMGTAWSEPTLIALAYAFEQATGARRAPRFERTLRLG